MLDLSELVYTSCKSYIPVHTLFECWYMGADLEVAVREDFFHYKQQFHPLFSNEFDSVFMSDVWHDGHAVGKW